MTALYYELVVMTANQGVAVVEGRRWAGESWLDSAIWLWVRKQFGRVSGRDPEAVFLHLLTLARAQFAVERSYECVMDAQRRDEAAERDSNAAEGINSKLHLLLDIHASLVSAHLYWRALKALETYLNVAELSATLTKRSDIIRQTKVARDHLEHLYERIEGGRSAKFGEPMPKDVFRQAVGRFDGRVLTFDNETFDLHAIHQAVRDTEDNVGKLLQQMLEPTLTLQVGPSKAPSGGEPVPSPQDPNSSADEPVASPRIPDSRAPTPSGTPD